MQETLNAGTELWKVGGIAAVLLAILVFSGWLMFRFFVKMVSELGSRLNFVQDHYINNLSVIITENTSSNKEVAVACKELRASNIQVVDVLRGRPCLIETEKHPVVKPSLHHFSGLLLFGILLLSGCTQAQVDRAKAAQSQAEERLAQAHIASEQAIAAYEQMKALALTIGGAQAEALVKKGEIAVEATRDAEKVAKVFVETTSATVVAAEKSHAAGGLTFDVILAAIAAFATGGASIAATVVPLINKYKRAVTVTTAHADRMEQANTPEAITDAKQISAAEQNAAGVRRLIEQLRA